jgi:hypothetical protein
MVKPPRVPFLCSPPAWIAESSLKSALRVYPGYRGAATGLSAAKPSSPTDIHVFVLA